MFRRVSRSERLANTAASFGESRRRRAIFVAAMTSVAGLVTASLFRPAPRLIWNASASAPLGSYWVVSSKAMSHGDLVLADLPPAARMLAAKRQYLPLGVPLVKRVAALTGDTVCSLGLSISINGRAIAQRLPADSRGRALPVWQGCCVLADGDAFLLMPDVPDSFDGRYFGVIDTAAILGKLVPLWTW